MLVLITGASGGFGSVLGATLQGRGLRVYGTARDPSRVEPAPPFPLLPLEVTDARSVEACVKELSRREGRIDVLVNCVNQMLIGTVEEQSVEEVQGLFDTNVFGVLRVCQQVIPVMREQGGGTIVNMSSLGGLLAVPTMSAYTSAKFALEALSESMHHELARDGIDVVIMQPVAMAMERPATGAHLRLVDGVREGSMSHKMLERMARDTQASKLTPEQVAEEVWKVISRERKPLRVPLDRARALGWVKALAPQPLIDRLMRGLLA